MTSTSKTIIYGLIAVLVMCVASYFAGRVKGREIGYKKGYSEGYDVGFAAIHPSDTLIIRDTLMVDHPVVVEKEKIRVEYVAVKDTVRITDSLYVPIPIEAKIYKGDDYEAQVSGYHPELDWVKVFPKTTIVTNYVEKKVTRWGFGVTAGPGMVWDGSFHGGVGIVAGLSYRF